MSLHALDDPWRQDPHPIASTSASVPSSPQRRAPSTPMSTPSRKGKEKALPDQGARLSTMDRLNVLSSVVDSSSGRDKVLKTCQYAAKGYIWLYINARRSVLLRLDSDVPGHIGRLGEAASSLSLARKCLRLFGPIPPLNQLLQPHPLPPSAFFGCILALLTACADDMVCLSKLGLVGKKRGLWADKWANRFWLLKSLMELFKLPLRRSLLHALFPRLTKRRSATDIPKSESERETQELWTARKLWCDVIHAGYNVFRLQAMKEPVQTFTGLAAGLISASQLVRKEEVKLLMARRQ